MNRSALALLWLAGAAACGKPGQGSSGPTIPGVPGGAVGQAASAPDGKLHDGPPLATPGEHMQYSLSLRGIDLATFDLGVGEVADLGGKQAVVVQGHAKITGLASFMATIDDRFTSWVDVASGHSLRFQTDEFASGSNKDVEHSVVDLAARAGDTVPVNFHVNDAAGKDEPQTVSQPVVWDYNAFLLALRGWEGPPGSALTFEVFRSRFVWHVEVTIKGKEQRVTKLGELPALRIEGKTYKLDRKGGRAPSSDERMFTIWISDDDGRVPLEIAATTDYGELKMAITDYQPGTGQRLRP
ncbi:MAG TPA: DUF3108 domain-containing protein [Kofleriaceae bacterium]|nr:DUF3108 domain-containing protein [Kofleriaceae bacterium]